MTFVNPKPLGWAYGEPLTSAQMNSFGTQIISAVDGSGGGSYTLGAPLTFDGSLVNFDFGITTPTISGDTSISGTLDVGGDAAIVGALTAAEVTTDLVLAGTVDANNITAAGTLGVTGAVTLADACSIGGLADLTAQVNLGASASSVFLKGATSPYGQGRILERGFSLPDSNATVDMLAHQVLYVPAANAARAYTLDGSSVFGTSSTSADDWFTVQNDSSNTQNFSGLVSFSLNAGQGVKYLRISGTWRQVQHWG